MNPSALVVISGSFRRSYPEIRRAAADFRALGVEVLSPRESDITNPGEDFVLLESDDASLPPTEIEMAHLRSISRADALYVVNPGGRVGASTALEVGWARAIGRPIFFQETCEEVMLRGFGDAAMVMADIHARILESRRAEVDSESPLRGLQQYVARKIIERGFQDETPKDVMFLMFQELAEVAKAVGKFSGIKTASDYAPTKDHLGDEMADVFFLLMDLANRCDIDLMEAFRRKEARNALRTWK